MIPLRDDNRANRSPVVTWLLVAACLVVFLLQLRAGSEEPGLYEEYGMIPARVTSPEATVMVPYREQVVTPRGPRVVEGERRAAPSAVPAWLTILTCIFLHGGWMHLVGNMWFLWIFGDNVEDRFGRLGYLVLYLGSGVAASITHWLSEPTSPVPTVGASGAVAGVMGAYLVLYPRARVLALLPIGFFITTVVVPAFVFLLIWFAIQFVQGSMAAMGGEAGGVAWWAHVGGYVVGAGLALLLRATDHLRPAPVHVELHGRGLRRRPRD